MIQNELFKRGCRYTPISHSNKCVCSCVRSSSVRWWIHREEQTSNWVMEQHVSRTTQACLQVSTPPQQIMTKLTILLTIFKFRLDLSSVSLQLVCESDVLSSSNQLFFLYQASKRNRLSMKPRCKGPVRKAAAKYFIHCLCSGSEWWATHAVGSWLQSTRPCSCIARWRGHTWLRSDTHRSDCTALQNDPAGTLPTQTTHTHTQHKYSTHTHKIPFSIT